MTEQLIIEILKFFRSCGGPYQQHKPSVVYRIIECLEHGQYMLERAPAGNIIQACCYWKIQETDFEKAKRYIQPDDPHNGPVFYLTDYASTAGVNSFQDIAARLDAKEPGTDIFCFERKGRFVVWDRINNNNRPWVIRR